MGKSLQELAITSSEIQVACNLSGVIHEFSRVLTRLWEIADEQGKRGTDWVNTLPISIAFGDKISQLTGTFGHDLAMKAHGAVLDIARTYASGASGPGRVSDDAASDDWHCDDCGALIDSASRGCESEVCNG